MDEELEIQRVKEILNKFERCMDSLVGMPNNDRTLAIAQEFVNRHVQEMRGLGYKMKDRWNIPSVWIYGSLITCPKIEFEKEGFPIVVIVGVA